MELLPLKDESDLKYVRELLIEFKEKTGSIIAAELLNDWPASTSKFVKVYFFRVYVARLCCSRDSYNVFWIFRYSRTSIREH